jgi:hypothetical protein
MLRLRRPVPGVVVLIISGTDVGEHGTAPFAELATDLVGEPFDLFVDARASRGVTIDVSSEWSRWLAKHKRSLLSIHMLTGSRFVQLTANFVRNFSELGELMRIYTEPAAFEAEHEAAIERAQRAIEDVKLLGLVGTATNGVPDASENHDHYLAEAEIARWRES